MGWGKREERGEERRGQQAPPMLSNSLAHFRSQQLLPDARKWSSLPLPQAQGRSQKQMADFDLTSPLHLWQVSRGTDRRNKFPAGGGVGSVWQ